MKFIVGPKKRVTSGFGPGGIGAEHYKQTVGHYHTGVDYSNGYGSPVVSDNYGIVYKVNTPDQSPSGWCGVYYLCPDDKYGWVEVCQGHLSKVFVSYGDVVREGQVIGLEGNKGEVYSGGVRITKAMQEAGDRRGSHVHEQFRPVKKVKRVKKNKHYLNGSLKHGYSDALGRYRDEQGNYFEIQLENEMKGCVDPYEFVKTQGHILASVVNLLLAKLRLYSIRK